LIFGISGSFKYLSKIKFFFIFLQNYNIVTLFHLQNAELHIPGMLKILDDSSVVSATLESRFVFI